MAIIASYTIGPWLVKLVTGTNNPIVIKNATNYLKFDTLFYYVTAVICIVRNAMQGLGEQITPLVSSSLEMVGKIVIAWLYRSDSGRADSMVYHGDTAFGEDIQHAGA